MYGPELGTTTLPDTTLPEAFLPLFLQARTIGLAFVNTISEFNCHARRLVVGPPCLEDYFLNSLVKAAEEFSGQNSPDYRFKSPFVPLEKYGMKARIYPPVYFRPAYGVTLNSQGKINQIKLTRNGAALEMVLTTANAIGAKGIELVSGLPAELIQNGQNFDPLPGGKRVEYSYPNQNGMLILDDSGDLLLPLVPFPDIDGNFIGLTNPEKSLETLRQKLEEPLGKLGLLVKVRRSAWRMANCTSRVGVPRLDIGFTNDQCQYQSIIQLTAAENPFGYEETGLVRSWITQDLGPHLLPIQTTQGMYLVEVHPFPNYAVQTETINEFDQTGTIFPKKFLIREAIESLAVPFGSLKTEALYHALKKDGSAAWQGCLWRFYDQTFQETAVKVNTIVKDLMTNPGRYAANDTAKEVLTLEFLEVAKEMFCGNPLMAVGVFLQNAGVQLEKTPYFGKDYSAFFPPLKKFLIRKGWLTQSELKKTACFCAGPYTKEGWPKERRGWARFLHKLMSDPEINQDIDKLAAFFTSIYYQTPPDVIKERLSQDLRGW